MPMDNAEPFSPVLSVAWVLEAFSGATLHGLDFPPVPEHLPRGWTYIPELVHHKGSKAAENARSGASRQHSATEIRTAPGRTLLLLYLFHK